MQLPIRTSENIKFGLNYRGEKKTPVSGSNAKRGADGSPFQTVYRCDEGLSDCLEIARRTFHVGHRATQSKLVDGGDIGTGRGDKRVGVSPLAGGNIAILFQTH